MIKLNNILKDIIVVLVLMFMILLVFRRLKLKKWKEFKINIVKI